MKSLYRNISLLVLITFSSCVEPFQPNIPDSDKSFLVVEGVITDKEGPYFVKITKSSSLNQEVTAASGAEVIIEDDNGLIETLTEIQDGIYQTDKLIGVIGNKYRLSFKYQNQDYQSSWEEINTSPTIDSLYYSVDTKQTTDIDSDIIGLQFFLDNHAPANQTKHFRFEWEETWKIEVPVPSFYDYVGNGEIRPKINPPHVCWRSNNSASINLGTTQGLDQNILSNHSLPFIDGKDERFTIRYSLLVKQYGLSEEEYLFWKSLEESNEQLGGLMDKQPARAIGNLTNITNSNEVVLGYFSASGLEEKRIYISRLGLPPALTVLPTCSALDTLNRGGLEAPLGDQIEAAALHGLNNGKVFIDISYSKPPPDPIVSRIVLSAEHCSDCTLRGGTLVKPDFWNE